MAIAGLVQKSARKRMPRMRPLPGLSMLRQIARGIGIAGSSSHGGDSHDELA